ncbi:uncharacterized protein GGS25DRAFT_506108 [Hypoxylon fragiforme]|uniref:uncharacterized protein n=1 Tax=Hypoxylon fragiforme TaxID=63214 RepID=UPI0020C745F8|nr:uncharacterized protein GGS25DRAFT_506108 [Hypoxylon fragiforme]KAI2603905.1 hypothetical protein GGS25DRAFT_506108 [Hypoxylon fragiforme]
MLEFSLASASTMMLSKPGVSIRRLISQRRSIDQSEDGVPVSTDRPDHKAGKKDTGTYRKRPYGYKKRPPPPIIVSREQSIHDILNSIPPLPPYEIPRSSEARFTEPRSSESSLNSYEHYQEGPRSIDSKRSRSPLCSTSSSKDAQSQESLQLPGTASYKGDGSPPRSVPKHHARSSESLSLRADSPSSLLNSPEALSSQQEKNKATRSKPHSRRQESLASFSSDIQQLIHEADEAFKAVGSALAEVQLTTKSASKELTKASTPDSSPILKPTPVVSPDQMQNSPRAPAVSPILAPNRNIAVSNGVKRNKSKKSKKAMAMKSYRKANAAKPAKNGPRWTLSDNVTELFSGKLFHRIEVDEMLTPGQLEAYKLRRLSIMQSKQTKKSTETIDAEASDTPIEPFHLEDLSSRIGSAGIINDNGPIEGKHASPSLDPVVRRDFSVDSQNEDHRPNESHSASSQTDIGEEQAEYKNATYPTPPMRHPARFGGRNQKTSLPSIPETSTITSPIEEPIHGQSFIGSQDMVVDSNFVFLQSAPCSVTCPSFRQGPIRLAKLDLMPDMKVGADEGLDWTAFQMAIAGGAGDWFSESDDTIRRREAEEVEDLVDWFGSLNFDSIGGLVAREIEAPSPTSMTSDEDYSDVSYTEIEKDNPYSSHHQWQPLRHRGHRLELDMQGLQLDTLKNQFRESYASLPQSPMLDLRVIHSEDGDDVDVVPMGYNLGHDLGDFLKWEAEHAYAGDFYSS